MYTGDLTCESYLHKTNNKCQIIIPLQDTQKEIVLMVFLRLVEDSISMDSHLHQHRKKEITQCLHLHMEEFFSFFIETLKSSTTAMIEMVLCNFFLVSLRISTR